MSELFPIVEPYDHGMLDVGQGNQIYWEVRGNPRGKPAVVVHGGPGSRCSPAQRDPRRPNRKHPSQFFGSQHFRVVLFDQRGCGRSLPHASDPATDMSHNTTEHLVADMELLRGHLGIERWLLFGGSWGSTLILAYAERYPERVSEIVIPSVTTFRPSEIDWLYRGARVLFPSEWERFAAGVPEAKGDGDLVAAYARRMEHPDAEVRTQAAIDWCAWEDAVLSLEPKGKSNVFSGRPLADKLALVRVCSHYFAHHAWLDDGILLREAGRLAGIPGILIHGRHDLSCPLTTAWELARGWPDARLVTVADAGHTGSQAWNTHIIDALKSFC